MRQPIRFGLAAAIVGITLAGCGGAESTEAQVSASSTSSATPPPSAMTTVTSATPVAPLGATLNDYVREAGLTQTVVTPGEAGAPTINLPVPPGWEVDRSDLSGGEPSGAIVYAQTGVPDNPPRIVSTLLKLTGEQADPAKVLAYAPGQVRVLPGFELIGEQAGPLGGYDGYQIAGMHGELGQREMVALKTVVIPTPDNSGLYVLMLDASGSEPEAWVLADATVAIDDSTTITF